MTQDKLHDLWWDDTVRLVHDDEISDAADAGNLSVQHFDNVRGAITRLAESSRETGLYKSDATQSRIGLYLNQYKAMPKESVFMDFWMDFLSKIVDAPTGIHQRGAIILFIPMLDDLLNHFSGAPERG